MTAVVGVPVLSGMDLFDGSGLDGWEHIGDGGFELVEGTLVTRGGMGLLWYRPRQFGDVVLEVEWRVRSVADNGGVFLRFPDPQGDPWNPVEQGYEVQILDDPDAGDRATAAIYRFAAPTSPASHPPGEWNRFAIRAEGQDYTVTLNDVVVTRFRGDRSLRGHVGLQNHDDESVVEYRAVRVTELAGGDGQPAT